ncbi:dihydroneopterin aldolase [Salinisphaera orenii MK-B5]|uniref:Thiol:disulfide interchange protein n=1 Tax=Salinisphaera orenii MK-B5 TaxID=856730 RepID=A0A423PSB8_9GAMM|nr:thiol:disulfide interchange protein DsbG [Salinisphaera orenii]ROO28474.1 dihydroneopterin aldolase [Salinisphaera orenii MK-B5]
MSRTVRIATACLLGLALGAFGALAQAQPWPAPIRSIEDKGVTIVGQFDAPGGMQGFAARAGDRPVALYLTPDGEHVIVGTMLDADGENVSKPKLDALVKTPSRADAWAELEQAHWIGDGDDDAPRTLYVFTDPNCPYCHKFYEAARPWVEAGAVQLRHIPVGILKPTSEGKAAALLAADDPEEAMRAHENNYRSGGIEPMEDIPEERREQVAANNQLMSRVGVRGTPGIFYHDSAGEVQVKQGVPRGELREEILGPKPD